MKQELHLSEYHCYVCPPCMCFWFWNRKRLCVFESLNTKINSQKEQDLMSKINTDLLKNSPIHNIFSFLLIILGHIGCVSFVREHKTGWKLSQYCWSTLVFCWTSAHVSVCVCVGPAEAHCRAEAAAGSLLQTGGRSCHRAHPDSGGHER